MAESICIAVDGELSIFTVTALRERLLEGFNDGGDVAADLSGVTEMDSAGLQLLLAAQKEAIARGRHFSLVGRSQSVADILDLCGVADGLASPEASGGAQ